MSAMVAAAQIFALKLLYVKAINYLGITVMKILNASQAFVIV